MGAFSRSKVEKVNRYLTKEVLYKYLVVHKMTVKQLGNYLGVSETTISNKMKNLNFDLREERLKYENRERVVPSGITRHKKQWYKTPVYEGTKVI